MEHRDEEKVKKIAGCRGIPHKPRCKILFLLAPCPASQTRQSQFAKKKFRELSPLKVKLGVIFLKGNACSLDKMDAVKRGFWYNQRPVLFEYVWNSTGVIK